MTHNISVANFNRASSALREAFRVVAHGRTVTEGRRKLKNVFKDLDEDGNGTFDTSELRHFIVGVGVGIDDENMLNLLCDSIDINRDGIITSQELEDFIWPMSFEETANSSSALISTPDSASSNDEFGLILTYVRKAVIRVVGGAAAEGTDEALLAAFGAIAKSKLRHGGLLDDVAIKKAFKSLSIKEIQPRQLKNAEIDLLLRNLDVNSDGVVSAKEFKSWLFPHPSSAHHSKAFVPEEHNEQKSSKEDCERSSETVMNSPEVHAQEMSSKVGADPLIKKSIKDTLSVGWPSADELVRDSISTSSQRILSKDHSLFSRRRGGLSPPTLPLVPIGALGTGSLNTISTETSQLSSPRSLSVKSPKSSSSARSPSELLSLNPARTPNHSSPPALIASFTGIGSPSNPIGSPNQVSPLASISPTGSGSPSNPVGTRTGTGALLSFASLQNATPLKPLVQPRTFDES